VSKTGGNGKGMAVDRRYRYGDPISPPRFLPGRAFSRFDRFTRRWKAVNQPLLIGLVLQSTAVSGSGPSVGENPYIAKILRIPDEKIRYPIRRMI
jgi:hypothetical protein